MALQPDLDQASLLEHDRGPLLVTGSPGPGKTCALRERFARLVETGADPERIALVVRTRGARQEARAFLLARLRASLPALKVMTIHGLAHHVMAARFGALDYPSAPEVLTAADQFSKVRELLSGEDPGEWPACHSMIRMRGFADEVRQFIVRAQEALATPEDILERAGRDGLEGWKEVALFYRRYLEILAAEGSVDFAGLVNQAAVAVENGDRLLDHILVDDYQESTFAEERLLAGLRPDSLVAAGDPESHVFSFQGTTDVPIRRFTERFAASRVVTLSVNHRTDGLQFDAWYTPHVSEEYAAVARELRRIHVEDHVSWSDLAVVVRRQGPHVGGLLRALDDAGVPRSPPEGGPSLLAEPATYPFVLALRWLARPEERDGLVEAILTSELAALSPATARGLVRGARGEAMPAAAALDRDDGLTADERGRMAAVRDAFSAAQAVADGSVLEAFAVLWRQLPFARRLVERASKENGGPPADRRSLDDVVAFAAAVQRIGEGGDASVEAFLQSMQSGEDGPATMDSSPHPHEDAVRILTAHGAAGREFDTVVVVGAVEGNFPSLSRPEPMFDLAALERARSQSERNRARLEDERRLFGVVASRARRSVLFTASDPHGAEPVTAARSRFVAERSVAWRPVPDLPGREPLSPGEAIPLWRRTLSDARVGPARRLAALSGLLALGVRPETWWFQREWTGTEEPLHEHVRVSYSKLDKLDNCALQFVLSEELGLEGQAGYHAWVGHLVHTLIEDVQGGRVERTEEALIRAAQDRWRPQQFPSMAVSEAFRASVTRAMLPAWFREYANTPTLASEVRFEFEFEGATVTGFIDRVGAIKSGGTQITDYKTGKARDARADDNLQLGIYYLAVNHAEELERFRPVKAVELAFLKDLRNGEIKRVQLGLNTQAQQEYEAEMSARLAGLVGRLRALQEMEVYRPDPRAQCRYCDFKTLCPLWPEGRELFPQSVERVETAS